METASQLAHDLDIHGPDSIIGQNVQGLIGQNWNEKADVIQAILECDGYDEVGFFGKENNFIKCALSQYDFKLLYPDAIICEGKDDIFFVLNGQSEKPTIQ